MKHMIGSRYIVKDGKGYSGLLINPDEGASIEGAKKAINESNSRAEKLGYKAQQWVIYLETWNQYYNDDDILEKEEHTTQIVEIYPERLDNE